MEIFLISVAIFSCCFSCILWINNVIQRKKLPYGCETIYKNFSYVQVLLANVCTCVCEIGVCLYLFYTCVCEIRVCLYLFYMIGKVIWVQEKPKRSRTYGQLGPYSLVTEVPSGNFMLKNQRSNWWLLTPSYMEVLVMFRTEPFEASFTPVNVSAEVINIWVFAPNLMSSSVGGWLMEESLPIANDEEPWWAY